jgi:ATP-dependent protease ClpP protease subunit
MPHDRPNRQRALRLLGGIEATLGRVAIRGEINFDSERPIRTAIEQASRAASWIDLRIDSGGGSIRVADTITRDLEQTGLPIRATVDSHCFSAAIRPLLAAHERVAIPTALFFIHPCHLSQIDGNLTAVEAPRLRKLAGDLEAMDREFFTMISSKLRLPPQLYQQARRRGLMMTAPLAVAFQLIDRIDWPQR